MRKLRLREKTSLDQSQKASLWQSGAQVPPLWTVHMSCIWVNPGMQKLLKYVPNQFQREAQGCVCVHVCARAYAHLQVLWGGTSASKVSLPTSLGLPWQIPALLQSSSSLSCCKVDPSHLLGHQPGRLWSGEPSEGIEFLPLPLEAGVGDLVGEEDNPSGDKGDVSQLGTWLIPHGPQGAGCGKSPVPASGDSPDTHPGLPPG